jgi:glucokinase
MGKLEKQHFAIGTDIGGGHIACAAIDLDKKKIVRSTYSYEKIDSKAEAEIIIDGWAKALNNTIFKVDSDSIAGIGFAMPGPFDYANGIALFEQVQKFEHLYGVNVAEEIQKKMVGNSRISLRFMNDATCFGIGESWIGKAKDYKYVVAITLGTGFGSAFFEAGVPIVDRFDVPEMGCVYHLPFEGSIADDTFSTRWYIKRYAQKTGKQVTGVKEIFDNVDNDSAAKECFIEFGNNLAEFSEPWLKNFQADAMVIGGNISGAYEIWGKAFEKSLQERHVKIDILLSDLMEDAALVGSARLVTDDYWQKVKGLLSKMS